MSKILELDNSLVQSIDEMKYSTGKDFEYWKKNPYKLPEGLSIDWKDILPDPPTNRSEQTKSELQYINLACKTRSETDMKLIHDVDEDPGLIFVPFLQERDLPYPKKEIETYWAVMYPIVMNLKWFHNRARPYQLGPRYGLDIQYITTKTHHTPAYPSGHTAYGHLISLILSEKYPEYAKKFKVFSTQTGQARVLQGVHYASDNTAAVKVIDYLWGSIQYKD